MVVIFFSLSAISMSKDALYSRVLFLLMHISQNLVLDKFCARKKTTIFLAYYKN